MDANAESTDSPTPVNGTDDREAHSKFWIAAYTRPKSEKKAATELETNPLHPIVTYVATQILTREWSDRKKRIESVVIPMVIFAKVSGEEDILEVKKHHLIRKVITFPGRKDPAHIPNKQIEQLKLMLTESKEPVEFVEGNFRMYDKVKVVRGNLVGLEGVVQRTSDGQSFIIITIDLLGGAKVEIDINNVNLI